jgi:YidC/Oxa1 family membrane protein insertase
MEKRVIIAFVLSFAVLYAFRALYSPPQAADSQQQTATAPSTAAPVPSSPAPAPQKVEEAPIPAAENVHGEKAEDVTIESPLYTATFSNIGGVLKSYRLMDYKDGEGHPLELINQSASSKVGFPLAIVSGDKAIDDELAKAAFASHRDGNTVTFEYASKGLYARKTLVFEQENYVYSSQTVLTKDGKAVPHALVWQGVFGDQSIPQDPARKNAVYQTDTGSFKRVALRSLKDPQTFTSARAGVEDQYFLAAFLHPDTATTVKVGKQDYTGPDGKPVSTLLVTAAVPSAMPIRVYIGPKQQEWLAKADPQLAAALDYGYFSFIAKPLVSALLWTNKYVHNFGWAIILLTVVLNLVLFPLRLKQQVSMLKMQKIQPQMRRLQDQYKKLKANDPRRAQVQSDMMNLYKEHGVNPMGGCLPLLLQMPLLFGFYAALGYSIELRRAPWIFWIRDLSQPDPFYVIPIAMAAAMFFQQKMTPTANVDPAQAKMMLIMPLVFAFMFINYSSGLSLYWVTGSIIGIGQQIFINKYWSPQAEAKLKAQTRREQQS